MPKIVTIWIKSMAKDQEKTSTNKTFLIELFGEKLL